METVTRLPISRFGTRPPITISRDERLKSAGIPKPQITSPHALNRSSRPVRQGQPSSSRTPLTAPQTRSRPIRTVPRQDLGGKPTNVRTTAGTSATLRPKTIPELAAIQKQIPTRIPGIIWATQTPKRSRSIKRRTSVKARTDLQNRPRPVPRSQPTQPIISIPSKVQLSKCETVKAGYPSTEVNNDMAVKGITRSRSIKKRIKPPANKWSNIQKPRIPRDRFLNYDSSAGDLSSAGMSSSSSSSRSLTFRPFTPLDELEEQYIPALEILLATSEPDYFGAPVPRMPAHSKPTPQEIGRQTATVGIDSTSRSSIRQRVRRMPSNTSISGSTYHNPLPLRSSMFTKTSTGHEPAEDTGAIVCLTSSLHWRSSPDFKVYDKFQTEEAIRSQWKQDIRRTVKSLEAVENDYDDAINDWIDLFVCDENK